jgi:hypothetical protein
VIGVLILMVGGLTLAVMNPASDSRETRVAPAPDQALEGSSTITADLPTPSQAVDPTSAGPPDPTTVAAVPPAPDVPARRTTRRPVADTPWPTTAPAVKPPTAVTPTATSPGPPDPRFLTCSLANAAGYGPYRRAADAEYSWYLDLEGDGVVC